MADPRIVQYLEALRAHREGQEHLQIPIDQDDEVGLLGRELVALSRDIEARLEESRQIASITQRVNEGLLLEHVLEHVYESFQPIIPYDRIGFSLLEDQDRVLRARWARTRAPKAFITRGYSARLEGSSLERIFTTGEPRILNDLEGYLRDHPHSESTALIVTEGMRSSLTCPLVAMGKPIGFIFFSSMKPGTYRGSHSALYRQIAGHLAVIVEKSRIYQQLFDLNEVKNRFLGIAAHDLRNPIGVVAGYAKLLNRARFGPVTPTQQEVLGKIEAVCQTMLDLVNDLLDVSAIEAGRLELRPVSVNMAELLRSMHEDGRLAAALKQIEVALEIEGELPAVICDPRRIAQVVDNLISNAIKFSHAGTTMTVRARALDRELEIAVTDQGQGIPRGELSRIFAPFTPGSTKPTAGEKSHGLGLAIIKRIVEAHGGHVSVESRVGHGSTFRVLLPLDGTTVSVPPPVPGGDPLAGP